MIGWGRDLPYLLFICVMCVNPTLNQFDSRWTRSGKMGHQRCLAKQAFRWINYADEWRRWLFEIVRMSTQIAINGGTNGNHIIRLFVWSTTFCSWIHPNQRQRLWNRASSDFVEYRGMFCVDPRKSDFKKLDKSVPRPDLKRFNQLRQESWIFLWQVKILWNDFSWMLQGIKLSFNVA